MKKSKFIVLSIIILTSLFANAQKKSIENIKPAAINCSQTSILSCNNVYNPEMSTNIIYNGNPSDAFSQGFIDNWWNSHGTPDLDDGTVGGTLSPPFPGCHAAFMYHNEAPNQLYWSEGVVGKIKKLAVNQEYTISFFIKILEADLTNSSNE